MFPPRKSQSHEGVVFNLTKIDRWFLVQIKKLVDFEEFKKLEGPDELWEVRAEFGSDAFRLLGFWDAGNLII